MSTPNFATEAGLAGRYPGRHFDRRERKLLLSAKAYIDAAAAAATPAAGSVTLSTLATGVKPSHVVKFAGTAAVTSSVTSQAITVTGVQAGDLVFAQMNTEDTSSRLVAAAVASTNTVTLTYSGTTGTGGNVTYQVLRAAS